MTRFEVSGFCPFEGRVPRSDDEYFEALSAAVFSCRFSPETVRRRWPRIRAAFAGFSLRRVASWPDAELDRLMREPQVIRNRKKILATLRNARDLLARAERHGGVRAYLESFRPDAEALVRELDGWAHYVGAPSIRGFLRCAGLLDEWTAVPRFRRPAVGSAAGGAAPSMQGRAGMVRIKRAYEPSTRSDGYRVLVDRLWPRGIRKDELALDAWEKELAPSHELRKWFGHDPARWTEFVERYRRELQAGPAAAVLRELVQRAARRTVTLVYGARDTRHNDAVVLQREIERLRGESLEERPPS